MSDAYMLYQLLEYRGRSSLNYGAFRGLFTTLDDASRYIEHNKDEPYFRKLYRQMIDPDIGGAYSSDSGVWVWKYEVNVGLPGTDKADRWIPDYYIVIRELVYDYSAEEEEVE